MTFRGSFLPSVTMFVTCALAITSVPALQGQEGRGTAHLMDPAALNEQAPGTFKAAFDTSAGQFVVEVHRDWAPFGADRFYNLVKSGFYDGNRFFYVNKISAVWGVHGDPAVAKAWNTAGIPNDPVGKASNKKGTVALLYSGGRFTQTTINIVDNVVLDRNITPFGQVVSGMSVVEKLYAGYGETYPTGMAPTMTHMMSGGNAYLEKTYPKLDYIKTATIVP